MRKARLASYLLVLAATAAWSQQAPAPKPNEAAPAPIVRDPHSTKADLAVPLCPATFNDSLETDGVMAKGTQGVTPPKLKHTVDAEFSDEARRQKRRGRITHFETVLSFVVNTGGEPENICLTQSAGYGLDAKAVEAVQQYMFAPAMKDGKPVAARLHVQVDFNLHFGLF